jgi:hypothetical protein
MRALQSDHFREVCVKTGAARVTDYPEGTIFIEIRSVYDGWSVAKQPDGTLVNRWPEGDRRHVETRVWMDQYVNDRTE